MDGILLRELGWLGGFIFGILWLLRLQIQQNKVNGHSPDCEKYRRELHERLVRMEEQVKHLANTDVPAVRARYERLNDELMVLRGQVMMELQGHPWEDREH